MCDKEGTKERVLKWKKMQGGWIMCALLKHMGTNIIFLQDRVVQKTNTEKLFTHISTLCTSSPPLSSTSQRAGQSLLCHFSCPIILLPREKQSVLDLKEKGSCLYHVQLSSRQNASAKVWREKCCHWGVAPFIRRLSRMDIMGWEGWGGCCWVGRRQREWICFLTPSLRSTARLIEASMRLFQLFCSLSFLLPWSEQTHSASASALPSSASVYVHAQALICEDLAVFCWSPPVLFDLIWSTRLGHVDAEWLHL